MCRQGKVAQLLFQYAKTFKSSSKCLHVQGILSSFENSNILPSSLMCNLRDYTNIRGFRCYAPLLLLNEGEIKRHMNEISDKFGEAMELLSDARSSMGTTYFSDDMTEAEATIDEVLKEYETLLKRLTDSQSKDVTRAIGLKMEELKAQLQLLKESIKE